MPRPSFSQLPLNPSDPPYSAWGLYGPDDQLGTLNLLTPEVIKEASKEIQTGVRIGLTLPMNYLLRPSHNRLGIRHEIIHKSPRAVYDDVIEMNTQVRLSILGSGEWNVCMLIMQEDFITVGWIETLWISRSEEVL
jgi:hypothetical protein